MSEPPSGNGYKLLFWRLDQVEQAVRDLDQKVDTFMNRLAWAVIGAAFGVAGTAVGLLVTLGGA